MIRKHKVSAEARRFISHLRLAFSGAGYNARHAGLMLINAGA